MKHLGSGAAAVLILVIIGGGLWLWWDLDLRWRPHTITKDQAKIAGILNASGWVSPQVAGPRLYMISYGDCAACLRFQTDEFPKLRAAGIVPRVIVLARPDKNGLANSTPAERDTVAELWVNRDWGLYERWTAATPPGSWTAPGLAHADGDAARSAVIEAGRSAMKNLRPLLGSNGIRPGFPTLIWWTSAGMMRGCACEDSRSFGNVVKDLGA